MDSFETDFEFQSTRPVRSATSIKREFDSIWEVSIHAPREERDELSAKMHDAIVVVSIHAPREERDIAMPTRQSVSSEAVSIHAPREERDKLGVAMGARGKGFNPRAP
mgnify:CR=1 FL=1